MGDRLATIDMGRKVGAAVPLSVGSWVSIFIWAEAYLRTKWHLDPSSRLATMIRAEKWWGCSAHFFRGTGSRSNTILPGLRPTSVPSATFIHPVVWSQQTWPKIGGGCAAFLGELSPHLTQCALGRGLPPYQMAY